MFQGTLCLARQASFHRQPESKQQQSHLPTQAGPAPAGSSPRHPAPSGGAAPTQSPRTVVRTCHFAFRTRGWHPARFSFPPPISGRHLSNRGASTRRGWAQTAAPPAAARGSRPGPPICPPARPPAPASGAPEPRGPGIPPAAPRRADSCLRTAVSPACGLRARRAPPRKWR